MSIDDIRLFPTQVYDLYQHVLVGTLAAPVDKALTGNEKITFLGKHEQKITILVNEPGTTYLADDHLTFLMNILNACQLSMADIALVNLHTRQNISDKEINLALAPKTVLLFGIDPLTYGLPLQFPQYQVQSYNNQIYLFAPALALLKSNKDEKTKLWTALKKIFLNG